jgi:hypothetical protein
MSDDLDGLISWAWHEGEKRHEKLARSLAAGDSTGLAFQVLYEATVMTAFAELRAVFEVAVKEYNDGCGFEDVRIGYSDLKPKVIQIDRRHSPRFTLTIDAGKPRGTALRAGLFTPDADLFKTPPPDEMFIALIVDASFKRVVLQQSAYLEAQRLLRPVLNL